MTVPLSLATRQARLLVVRAMIDAGGGQLRFYENDVLPDSPETAITDQLLATVLLDTPSGSIGSVNGVATLTMAVPRINLASVSGLVGKARFTNGAGDGVADMLVSVLGALPVQPVVVSALQLYAGGELQLVSCVLSE